MAQRSLIGVSPDQVSTNGMLGDLAFQDSDSVYIETIRGKVSLDKLDKEITDTAVDIFVYDTRKDSDGGAWRKRTQHTSWYNETLNTATRGNRREFPAVAVIVIDGTFPNTVTIYDADDPDLPMWMVFETGRTPTLRVLNWWTSGNGLSGVNSVVALNGLLVISPGNGTCHFDFIKDSTRLSYGPVGSDKYQVSPGTILTRNNYTTVIDNGDGYVLVQSNVNDVAMTVLPNAPIDSATGLPVPTIAVATDGGLSVIRDDGTVISGGEANSSWKINKLIIDSNNTIWASEGSDYSPGLQLMSTVPYTSVASIGTGTLGYQLTSQVTTAYGRNTFWPFIKGSYGAFVDEQAAGKEHIFSGSLGGLTFLQDNVNDRTSSMVAYATVTYNTGWMHGDIKGAFLSDTTVESLTANTNLASNFTQFAIARLTSETYDAGDTSWQMVDDAATDNGYVMIQMSGLTIGQSYIVSVTLDNNATLDTGYYHQVIHKNGLAGENYTVFSHWDKTNASSETLTGVFVAQSVNDDDFLLYANAITLNVSNFIVRAVDDEDRSINNKGLQVFGTITKSAVATGAELVAYGGWSTSNYLEQPYNSDFNLTSTQDASWIIWFKNTESVETYYHFVDSGYVLDSLQHYWLVGLLGSGDGRPTFRLNGTTQQNLNGVGNYLDGLWHQIIVTRTGNGTLISMYIDGQLSSTLSTSSLEITHSTDAKLRIGLRGGTDNRPNTGGYLTQLRFSKSAPSAAQVKKIYEDEKVLFQENAACTLYGSSDAVTALAYDEVTEQLHVGTSSGRSDFQGLRRINNTTTEVTTAISASNGLIAEQ